MTSSSLALDPVTRAHLKRRMCKDLATSLAALATCCKRQVGCVLATPDFRYLLTGYNGPASGEDFCDGKGEPDPCLHAEVNALLKIRTEYTDMICFVTCAPCEKCAGYIINSKAICEVVIQMPVGHDHNVSWLGIDRLRNAGIRVGFDVSWTQACTF